MSDALHRLGRDVVGPALVLQIRWALELQARLALRRMCFAAHDGWFLRALYDRLADGEAKVAPSCLVSLTDASAPIRLGLAAFRPSRAGVPTSLSAVLAAHGLDDEEVGQIVARAGYGDPARPLPEPWNDRGLHLLLDDPALVEIVAARGAVLSRTVVAEVGAEAGSRVGFVGFGFDTRVEEALTDALAPGLLVEHGLYLALLPPRDPSDVPPERRLGLLFDYRRPRGTAESAITQLAWLFSAACARGSDDVVALQAGILDAADRAPRGLVSLLDERPGVVGAIERLAYFPTKEEARALGALERRRTDAGPHDPVFERLARAWKGGLLVRVGGRPLCEAYYRYQRLRVSRRV